MHRTLPVILIGVAFAIGCGGEPSHGLEGRWRSTDYTCYGKEPEYEIVEIAIEGRELVATKVIGDPCVPAGDVTFRGELGDEESKGEVDCMVGEPDTPSNGSFESAIVIESENAFSACRLKFVRVD